MNKEEELPSQILPWLAAEEKTPTIYYLNMPFMGQVTSHMLVWAADVIAQGVHAQQATSIGIVLQTNRSYDEAPTRLLLINHSPADLSHSLPEVSSDVLSEHCRHIKCDVLSVSSLLARAGRCSAGAQDSKRR